MPTYDYYCGICKVYFDRYLPLSQYKSPQKCIACKNIASKIIRRAPMVKGDLESYDCPITGKRIEGRRAHEENLKRHGCRVLEAGETRDFQRQRQAEADQLDDKIAATIEREILSLPPKKQEQLTTELANGADLQVTRA